MRNKFLRLIVIILFLSLYSSCVQKEEKQSREPKSSILIGNEKFIVNMMNEQKYKETKLVLDSLISINSSEPFFYNQRGWCNTYLLLHEEAINDFKKSLNMNYKVKSSNKMIEFNRELLQNYNEVD